MVEEYEHVERLYYGKEQPSPAEDLAEMKRIYEFAQVERRKRNISRSRTATLRR
jgi:lysyl-tRNA synthetase class I